MYIQIKSLLMISIVLVSTAQYAAADNFSAEDMAFVFADSVAVTSDFGQIEVLSRQEMMETEGEFIQFLWLAYRIGKIGHSFYKMNRARTFYTYSRAKGGFAASVYHGAKRLDINRGWRWMSKNRRNRIDRMERRIRYRHTA